MMIESEGRMPLCRCGHIQRNQAERTVRLHQRHGVAELLHRHPHAGSFDFIRSERVL